MSNIKVLKKNLDKDKIDKLNLLRENNKEKDEFDKLIQDYSQSAGIEKSVIKRMIEKQRNLELRLSALENLKI